MRHLTAACFCFDDWGATVDALNRLSSYIPYFPAHFLACLWTCLVSEAFLKLVVAHFGVCVVGYFLDRWTATTLILLLRVRMPLAGTH